jgi:outer membrane protein OmpA-like peptidoglycan-associated protein
MKKIFTIIMIQMNLSICLVAQAPGTPSTTGQVKDNAWEIGLHAGHLFTNGNIDFIPGYGGGIHIRRALDYVFSLRAEFMFGSPRGEDEGNVRSFESTWVAGSLQLVTSLNNLKWNPGERKTNIYALGGIGLNSFDTSKKVNGTDDVQIEADLASHGELGAGVAFRINNRFNFGIEHKATFVFGSRSDDLDGVKTITVNDSRGTIRDVLNYTSVRLNINLGNFTDKTEPLYWLNPLDAVVNDMARLRDTRLTLGDADNDGVIDMMDDEENTPQGASVNTKGVTLDSDGDGIADYVDKEPFSPGGYQVNGQGVAQIPDPTVEMRRYIDGKLRNFTPPPTAETSVATTTAPGFVFLPNIYFPLGGSAVTAQQVSTVANIAQLLKSNPQLRLVVIGHADERGGESANQSLSYRRAKAVIDLLTDKFQVSKNQLILQYKGESAPLIAGASEVNRRVELKLASGETDMPAPSGN